MEKCQVCSKPLKECREVDKQLIKPYDPRNNKPFIDTLFGLSIELHRCIKNMYYQAGAYNPENNTFYAIAPEYRRKSLDWFISQPLCVFEREIRIKELYRQNIILLNIRNLPLRRKYRAQLYKLLR